MPKVNQKGCECMGYTTDFAGEITIEPPLNEHEISFLKDFNEHRRMSRHKGAYFVKGSGDFGQGADEDVIDHNGTECVSERYVKNPGFDEVMGHSANNPRMIRIKIDPVCPPESGTPAQMPGLWCQWVPGGDLDDPLRNATVLGWDGGEKFYDSVDWMIYLVDNFLRPHAFASSDKGRELVELAGETERFSHFTFDHVLNGIIEAQGEESDDHWRLVVVNNEVSFQQAQVIWPDLPEPH